MPSFMQSLRNWVVHLVWTVIVLAGISGCTTTQDVINAPLNEGSVLQISASYDQTTKVALEALRALGISVTSVDALSEGTLVMIGRRMSAFSWGEVGRVFIEKSSVAPTKIFVIWEKRSTYQFAGSNRSEFVQDFEKSINKALAKK